MSIGTLYVSHSTAREQADFDSIPFNSASITHNRDKASSMSFKSPMKLEEGARIIYTDLGNNTTFGGLIVKRTSSLGSDYSYEVIDHTRLYQSKFSGSFSNMTSSAILKSIIKKDANNLSTSGIQNTKLIHSYLKWSNVSIWDIIEQLAWLERQGGNYVAYDIDYTGTLIWKQIPQQVNGYVFSNAYSYEETRDSSDIVTKGMLVDTDTNKSVSVLADNDIIAKWGVISDIETCSKPKSNGSSGSCSTSTSYYTKCGLSPDKKSIVSVAKPSSADAKKYQYTLYRTVFQNYCPNCKKSGYLRFDGGKKTKCITSQKDGLGYKPSVQAEHEITCVNCDSDYCGVTGQEKSHGHISRLKTIKKPVKSSQTEFNKLTSGKLVYSKGSSSKCDTKNNTSLKNEANISKYNIDSTVWKLAVSLTSSKKTTLANAKALFNWVKTHTRYESYSNTRYGAAGCLKKRRGNCVDHAHLFAALCRSVGIKCNYIHNSCIHHVYNKVYISGKGVIVDTGTGTPKWGSHWGGSGCPTEKTSLNF